MKQKQWRSEDKKTAPEKEAIIVDAKNLTTVNLRLVKSNSFLRNDRLFFYNYTQRSLQLTEAQVTRSVEQA